MDVQRCRDWRQSDVERETNNKGCVVSLLLSLALCCMYIVLFDPSGRVGCCAVLVLALFGFHVVESYGRGREAPHIPHCYVEREKEPIVGAILVGCDSVC
ncbi:hypothetical protein NDU88_002120 [Pleurodeles waltl]|uniref:Uncharacterized protein n=1 Tax=Pleurodeles waltl TaxID=8319 RepID=A0AAV7Q805_PLEWA|nr:hypothetical protein NDU88_002120 [Pleurodeles waltl]